MCCTIYARMSCCYVTTRWAGVIRHEEEVCFNGGLFAVAHRLLYPFMYVLKLITMCSRSVEATSKTMDTKSGDLPQYYFPTPRSSLSFHLCPLSSRVSPPLQQVNTFGPGMVYGCAVS
jgi:hypothetical protein